MLDSWACAWLGIGQNWSHPVEHGEVVVSLMSGLWKVERQIAYVFEHWMVFLALSVQSASKRTRSFNFCLSNNAMYFVRAVFEVHKTPWSDGVVVITSALHADGREFDPRSDLMSFFFEEMRQTCPRCVILERNPVLTCIGSSMYGSMASSPAWWETFKETRQRCPRYVVIEVECRHLLAPAWSDGVAVITSASHAEGREFDPRSDLAVLRRCHSKDIHRHGLISMQRRKQAQQPIASWVSIDRRHCHLNVNVD